MRISTDAILALARARHHEQGEASECGLAAAEAIEALVEAYGPELSAAGVVTLSDLDDALWERRLGALLEDLGREAEALALDCLWAAEARGWEWRLLPPSTL